MTRIDFYVLASADEERWISTICKLIEKAHMQKKPVFIHTDTQEMAQRLDTALWGFKADSFIPHRTLTSPSSAELANTDNNKTLVQGSVFNSGKADESNATATVDIACGVAPAFWPTADSNIKPDRKGVGVLINLAREVPPFFSRFERTLEVVSENEEMRVQSRQRYSFYRERGYPMNHHKLG